MEPQQLGTNNSHNSSTISNSKISSGKEIRDSYLNFFKDKEHTIVHSASLFPTSPNLLFTNAGMNQFVDVFLEKSKPLSLRIADSQKCIRAGGKHNDLDDVGYDGYHHTLFEMLGNWSFGDYFKEDAIKWAWELLTKVWGFPKERLYATVYKPGENDPSVFDQEAYDIWHKIFKEEGMDPEVHICSGGKKDNFWMMGETGPCGPCSEIHMDLTPEGDTRGSLVNCDSGWCIELWNLVFIQMNAEEDGSFSPLPNKHVDTGMGLERIAGILATTKNFSDFSQIPSNYNSDLFSDIFEHITELTGHSYGRSLNEDRTNLTKEQIKDCVFRVLADHIRTLCFSIADGILPGNEGRNYVLRRILRRAVLYGKKLDLPSGFFTKLVDPLINKMGDSYPELVKNRTMIHKVIQAEEDAFDKTLDRGLQLFESYTKDKQSNVITGHEAFTLYDTYGFPLDLTQIVAAEKGFTVDKDEFEVLMNQQRQRARSASVKTTIKLTDKTGVDFQPTIFKGFNRKNLTGFTTKVLGVVNQNDTDYLVCEESVFYAEMGGQVGDAGFFLVKDLDSVEEHICIVNTIKTQSGVFLHELKKDSLPNVDLTNAFVVLNVDQERRISIERNHTATHLLHWALRKVLGFHVGQAGSLVDSKHFRFDFTHYEAVSADQLKQIEELVNDVILENVDVSWYEVPFSEKPDDVIAFFGEKYGEIVRVVDIVGFSKELCGGTHVLKTGELGMIKVLHESAIAAGTRRIEALTGSYAQELAKKSFEQLEAIAHKLSCPTNEITGRIDALIEQKKTLEKQIRSYEQKNAAKKAESLLDNVITTQDGLKWIVEELSIGSPNDMRGMGADLLKKLKEGVVILAGNFDDKSTVLTFCSEKAQNQGLNAGSIVKQICSELDGKGGGKSDFAMGGAKKSDNIGQILTQWKKENLRV